MRVNIKDIAKLSGVGISTVSRVINNTGYVSEATRKKVMDVVEQYQYIPNSSARNLKITQSKNIALLVKGITNPFFNKMIRVIEQRVALQGYPLYIQNVDSTSDELEIAIREAQDRNLCGVVIMGGSYDYSEENLRRLGVPCVLVTVSAGGDVDKSLYSSVTIDDEKEGYRVTNYLISQGHRKIGFIYYTPADENTPNVRRYKGYLRALEENNIPFDPSLVATMAVVTEESGYKLGFQVMKQLYSRNHDMTAVFAYADILAIGAAKAITSMGLRIPEDISIVGFDGIEAAEYYQPSLDTVYQPATEMALSSVELLLDMIQRGETQHVVYDCMLLKRGSCKNISRDV